MILLATELPSRTEIDLMKELLEDIDNLYECSKEHELESVIYPRLKELYQETLPAKWEISYLNFVQTKQ